MKIKDVFINMSYLDLARHYPGSKQSPSEIEKQLKGWYLRSKIKYGFDDSILNVALTIGIRARNNNEFYIPGNNYLNKILDRFKLFKVETLDDAVNQLSFNLDYELDKQAAATKGKPRTFENPDWANDYLQELKDEVATFEANERTEMSDFNQTN